MRPENTPFICVISGHIPKKKTSNSLQMQQMLEAKRREFHFGTHHKLIK